MFNLVLALFFSVFRPQTAVLSLEQVTKLMDTSCMIRIKAVVKTEKGPKKALFGCSGTFIAPNTVLTAAHCFQIPPMNVWVRGSKGDSHVAKIARLDFPHDLALLHVSGPSHVSAKLAKGARRGEGVTNIGSPFFFQFLVSEGLVSAIGVRVPEFKGTYIVSTAMINPGSSGGGAFNNKGELIGVNTMSVGGIFGWAGISMAVDLYTIREFLK